MTRDLTFDGATATQVADRVHKTLLTKRPDCYREIAEFLTATGVRRRWNAVFRNFRAAAIAKWILPHVEGDLLDLLCGDGRSGSILAEMGLGVSLVEREVILSEYQHVDRRLTWLNSDILQTPSARRMSGTVLLCTALHHEPEPLQLLHRSFELTAGRIIIIENCVEPDLRPSLHILIDDFFNSCLNETSLPCPAEHRPLHEWLTAIEPFAVPVFIDRVDRLPGIPMSHHLIVADLRDVTVRPAAVPERTAWQTEGARLRG